MCEVLGVKHVKSPRPARHVPKQGQLDISREKRDYILKLYYKGTNGIIYKGTIVI